MGWTPRRTRPGPDRFDAWQNRPDRPGWQAGRRGSGWVRTALIWLAAFALLAIGHRYGDVVVRAAEQALTDLSAWAGW